MGITNSIDIYESSTGELVRTSWFLITSVGGPHHLLTRDPETSHVLIAAGSLDILTSNNDDIVRCFSAETFQEKGYRLLEAF